MFKSLLRVFNYDDDRGGCAVEDSDDPSNKDTQNVYLMDITRDDCTRYLSKRKFKKGMNEKESYAMSYKFLLVLKDGRDHNLTITDGPNIPYTLERSAEMRQRAQRYRDSKSCGNIWHLYEVGK